MKGYARRSTSCSSLVQGLLLACLPLITMAQLPVFTPVTDAMIAEPDPADWLLWRRTFDSWGYSPLDQVNRDNVGVLELAWQYPVGPGMQEGAPIVHDGRMYVPNASDYIQAFNAATGDVLWEYHRPYPEGAAGGTKRTIALWGTTLIAAGSDNSVYALDALTGEQVWQTQVFDPGLAARATSGPMVANGKVITGRQCQPAATSNGCIITAHNAATGAELWRTRTIPQPGEPGDDSWGDVPPEERYQVGTWMVPSFDPELNLVFTGTSVTMPAPKYQLDGNDKHYLYHNSTLALDGDSGEIVWYYQHMVDHWDLDHVFERLLVDTAVAPDPQEVDWINPDLRAGEVRKVMTGIPGKTGIVYTLDRATGEFLWARQTITQNVIESIDGDTGEVHMNPDVLFSEKGQERFVCPGGLGGKNWQAGAYSPRTNTLYMPLFHVCMDAVSNADKGEWERSLGYGFDFVETMRPPEGVENLGTIWAVSAETGKTRWRQEQRSGVMSMVATGGGLVFAGDIAGSFKAYDDESGAVLWESQLGAPVSGYPIAFAANGKQYVAVTTGPSLLALGIGGLTPEVLEGQLPGGNVFVFTLPDRPAP